MVGVVFVISAKWYRSDLAVDSLLPLRAADIIEWLTVNSHLD